MYKRQLKYVAVNKNIAGRYYQEAAIKAVCNSFDEKNRRKALLVMATGSGKTRTVIALCDCLLKAGWIKNILFLADRNSLVTQAKRSFVNMLPNLSCTNLVEEKDNYNAHCVFSTYQTMMKCIDTVNDNEGKLFTCGHFDLVICDEAHRSIYNKYRDIFSYFDAPLVGLTATPKDEIDKNTYEVFELENGVPTYGYDLAQAVKDGYLVDYVSVESRLKFIEQGIVYDELSEEDKETYEATFEDENGNLPESISSSALNTWIFNEDTIKQVLHILMTNGIKIDYGQKLGKTIIFAKKHKHAEEILRVFRKEYPQYPDDYAKVIDNKIEYAQSAIDEFSDLMMAASKEVEDAVCRLAQMARAAGMHLIIATQRPTTDVITGLIKANIPSRIALTVQSQVDSRTILDTQGAEKLLGYGDMLYYPNGMQKPLRVQGCFCSTKEVESIVGFIKNESDSEYNSEIIEAVEQSMPAEKGERTSDSAEPVGDGDDILIEKAIDIVVEMGQASTSSLQRKLKLGYARAARIIDELENMGVVGPYEGAKPRKVLMSKQQWSERRMRKSVQE